MEELSGRARVVSVSFIECSRAIQDPSVSDQEVVALIKTRLGASCDDGDDGDDGHGTSTR